MTTEFDVNTRDFFGLINQVKALAGRDDTLPMLNAIRLEVAANELTATATDRYTLGTARLVIDGKTGGDIVGLLPLREVEKLQRIFKPAARTNPTLTLTFGDNGLGVCETASLAGLPNLQVGLPWLDAKFPAFRTILEAPQIGREIAETVGFNADYLARFRHAVRDSEPLVLKPQTHNKVLMIYVGDHFIGAIMPVRLSDANFKVWELAEPKPEPKKRAPRTKKVSA